jgi:hypothetical protein
VTAAQREAAAAQRRAAHAQRIRADLEQSLSADRLAQIIAHDLTRPD